MQKNQLPKNNSQEQEKLTHKEKKKYYTVAYNFDPNSMSRNLLNVVKQEVPTT